MFVYVTIVRTVIVYFIIIFALRVMGKRQLGELQPSELVVTILISNLATLPVEDTNVPLAAGIIPILLLVSFEVTISAIGLHHRKVRQLVSGNPIVVIQDGQIDQAQMKNLRLSVDDLMEQLRSSNIFDIRDVDYAVVETTGRLSVYQKIEAQAVTAKMVNITPDAAGQAPPALIVCDGSVVPEGLAFCRLSQSWLESVLQEKGYRLQDVFMMTCDRSATYFLVPKERQP